MFMAYKRKFPVGTHYQTAYLTLASEKFGIVAVEGNLIVSSGTISHNQVKKLQEDKNLFKTEVGSIDFIVTPEKFNELMESFQKEEDDLIEKYSLVGIGQEEIRKKAEEIILKESEDVSSENKISDSEIEKGFNSYIETLFWSSPSDSEENEFLDQERSKENFDPETLTKLKEEFKLFVKDNYSLCTEEDKTPGIEAFGHNFWLTRNGHGAGFWDGDYVNGEELTEASKKYNTLEPYVGDDEKVYIMGEMKAVINSTLNDDNNAELIQETIKQ